jgi:hypothetical protein
VLLKPQADDDGDERELTALLDDDEEAPNEALSRIRSSLLVLIVDPLSFNVPTYETYKVWYNINVNRSLVSSWRGAKRMLRV